MTTYHDPRYYPAIIYVDKALLSQTLVERDTAEFGKHPVITSFLWMKWQRIRKLFNRNLRLYLLFVTTLTWYIFERFGGVSFRSKPEPSPDEGSPEAQLFCSSSLLGKDPSVGFWYGAFLLQALFQLLSLARDWRKDIKESDCKVALQVIRLISQMAAKKRGLFKTL